LDRRIPQISTSSVIEEGTSKVQPIQIAALKYFLKYQGFEYEGYDVEAGVVIFTFIHGDYK